MGGIKTRQGLQRVPEGVGVAIGMEIGYMSKYFKDEGRHVFQRGTGYRHGRGNSNQLCGIGLELEVFI